MVTHSIHLLYKKSVFFACTAYCSLSGTLTAYAQAVQEIENDTGIDWSHDGLKIIFVVAAVYILARAFSRKRKSDSVQPQAQQRKTQASSFQTASNTDSNDSENTFGSNKPKDTTPQASPRERQAQAAWGSLMTQTPDKPSRETAGALTAQSTINGSVAEPGTSEDEFIRGAKVLYSRIYEDMDNNDLDDIRNFATKNGLDQIQELMKRRESPGTTDILLVNAEILKLDATAAAVRFNTLMRSPGQSAPKNISETWHFTRENPNQTWMVDSFEQ